ncbi:hypothetical protein [Parasitella parasitica]|uniref:C3H1-type domain-containing protein n=1 Tax=Parasitella parasitica TaxID=35722 RepID=A0A0B7NR59_9FUNG|nr:hypothetical protein [Parasitella parasitica]
MTEQNLLFSPDLTLNLLSKSSPSQLEPFQFKRSRTQPIPTEAFYTTQKLSSSSTQTNGTSSSNNSKSSNLSHVPCKFYKQGTCTAGANCTFSHSSDLSSESAVCKYFVKGNCKFGSKCALLHTMSPYGTSATSGSSSNKRMMASTPPSLPFPRRKTADQMMGFSPSNIDHRSFLHDPFASSAPAVSLLHLHEQQQQLWRNQGRTTLNPDIMGIRSSPREAAPDPFLGTSPFSTRLSSSVSNNNNSNAGSIQSPPMRYQPTSFGSTGQDNYDLNDAMLPSSLNDLFTPSELQVRRVRQQEHYPSNQVESWSMRDSLASSFDQRQWRVPFLTKSQQQQQQQQQHQHQHQQQQQQHQHIQQQLHYSSLPLDYEDRLIEGTSAINIPGGNASGSSSSSNDYLMQQQNDLLQQQDDEVQFFMEDDEAVTYDTTTTPSTTTTTITTADHKTLDMTTANNNKTYSSFPSLISLPST